MASYNAYQPYFPQYYNPQYQQPQPQPQQQAQVSNGIIWVQGEAGAKSYMVAPNNTVQLWDSESQTIYLKSADASGMPSMRILDYTIRSNASQMSQNAFSAQATNIPTREELEALKGRIDSLQEQFERAFSSQPQTRPNASQQAQTGLGGGNHE